MKSHYKVRSKKGIDAFRIVSAVLVLGILVLVVSESAKYLYVAKVPDSVSSRIEPSVNKLASVLGVAITSIDGSDSDDKTTSVEMEGSKGDPPEATPQAEPVQLDIIAKFAVLSDSHEDLTYLEKALEKAKDKEVGRVVFLGDYTDWGELGDLRKSREVMDGSELPYISLPGDHDLGQTRNESNFVDVFGKTYGTLNVDKVKITYFDNSKNYTNISEDAVAWFDDEISDTDILFLSQPLVTQSMSRVMGIIDGVKDEVVFGQNRHLLSSIRNSKVKMIMAGDLHQSSKYQDPEKPGLWHCTAGAVLKSSSLEKLNLQSPRFSVLTVYEDLSWQVEDVAID